MKKKVSIFLLLMFFIFAFVSFISFKSYGKLDIDHVLKSNSYSYLSNDVINYIKDYYEDTGEILLTEKNKKNNEPYLNPQYVEYLEYISSSDRLIDGDNKYDVIPSKTVIDYVYDDEYDIVGNNNLPDVFDLRNVSNKNFVTPIKNQGGTGLCWSFATNAQAESHLLVKKNESYTEGKSQIFSEMQTDYATASNGIVDGDTLYDFGRILSDGGTFDWATSVMKDGLGLVDVSWRDFNTYDEKPMEKNKIYNFTNSKYDVISTVNYPKLDLGSLDMSISENVVKRENYLNGLKQLIMDNGGAYVATGDPSSRCSITANGYKMLYDDGLCASAGHAMQIIGWDDNFEYSFCSGEKDTSGYYYLGNANKCTTGKIISGKGAWLLKNSWGNSLSYVYLAYDSIGTEYNMITEMEEKDWDNYYSVSRTTNNKYIFNPDHMLKEKLNKIKFTAASQNYNMEVCARSNSKEYVCKDVRINYPGIYTVDFSDDNIYIEGDLFVQLSSSLKSDIKIYTNIIDNDMEIKTDRVTFKNRLTNIDKYILRIPSVTVNVPEGSIVSYRILDDDKNEITTSYTYSENIVSANFIYSKLFIDNDIELGTYKLQVLLNNEVLSETWIDIKEKNVVISGSGDINNPYIITNPAQLNLIRMDRFAYYELANDIDLSYDTKNSNGLFYNDGSGWEPIRYSASNESNYFNDLYYSNGFSGGFDGKGFTIKGLYINRTKEDGVGLFSNTYNENYSDLYIKNVVLENPNIIGNNYVGALVGHVNGTTYERMTNISNVYVIGGKVKGNSYVGGIIGGIRAGSYLKKFGTTEDRHRFSNLYNSALVDAYYYGGGIVGKVMNSIGYKEGNSPIIIENVLNKGKVSSDYASGGIVGWVRPLDNNSITIRNSINTGYIDGDDESSNIFGYFSEADSVGQLNLSNIYYLSYEDLNFNNDMINIDNVSNKSIGDMKKTETYDSWNNFDLHWKIEEVDGSLRMPVLKNMEFDYLSISDISLEYGDIVLIDDYITPDIDAALDNTYVVEDNSIISIDGNKISAINVGNTKIGVISNYDGLEKDIEVSVIDEGNRKIKYYKNTVYNQEHIQTVSVGKALIMDIMFSEYGYTFVEWNTNKDGTGKSYFPGQEIEVIENLDLYAQWELNKYTVTFDPNGGVGTMNNQEFTHGVSQKINSNLFTKTGYIFKEWNTKQDGSGDSYNDNQEITVTGDLTLYVIWAKRVSYLINKYTIDEDNKYIDMVDVNTTLEEFNNNIVLSEGYSVIVDTLPIDGKDIVYTGGKVKIYRDDVLCATYTTIVRGDITGDGKIDYLDYVYVYNHIYKTKHPDSDKILLNDEYLLAADASNDNGVDYLDYVTIYNKIKELKGGRN